MALRQQWKMVIAGVIALVMSIGEATSALAYAQTLRGADFNPGNIISDEEFFTRDAMSEAEIQTFLNQKVGNCSNSRCLNIFKMNTVDVLLPERHSQTNERFCSDYDGADGETAARIIFKVQQACGVSAKVILVTLQKEQGLVTSSAPSKTALDRAQGYACPDGGYTLPDGNKVTCNPSYAGFFKQVLYGARQFKRYTDSALFSGRQVGKTTCLRISPSSDSRSIPFVRSSREGKVATLTTASDHKLLSCQPISVSGSATSSLNGSSFTVGDVVSPTQITYTTSVDGTIVDRSDDGTVKTNKCGYVKAKIANQATRALYIYTPYAPNAAALANIWGTGDGCSAYGNRNFWRQYRMWFNLKGELYAQVAALPSATRSALGDVVSESGCPAKANSCSISYQTGVVSLKLLPVSGPISVSYGAIGTAYRNSGGASGPLGAVAGSRETLSGVSASTGYRQKFSNGYIYELPNHATVIVLNAIHSAYVAHGGPAGVLGWPVAPQRCVSSSCDQRFDQGVLASSPSGTYVAITGAIGATFAQLGGISSPWGKPVSSASNVNGGDYGAGQTQQFSSGFAYERPAGVTFVKNELHSAYRAMGGVLEFGFPLNTTVVSGSTAYQRFESGWLFAGVNANSGRLLPQTHATTWSAIGGPTSYLGLLTSPVQSVSDGRGASGTVATYSGGATVSYQGGTFAYPNKMRTKYLAKGGIGGSLGWPTSNAVLSNYMWSQDYQNGTLRTSTRPTVSKGSANKHVTYLQRKLKVSPVSGYFGDITLRAVRKYQSSKGIAVTGQVTTAMWDLLG